MRVAVEYGGYFTPALLGGNAHRSPAAFTWRSDCGSSHRSRVKDVPRAGASDCQVHATRIVSNAHVSRSPGLLGVRPFLEDHD